MPINTFTNCLILILIIGFNAGTVQAQSCSSDVFVINDQSGSVDSVENTQGRKFITELANQMQPLGTGPTAARIAVSEFAARNTWQRFSFPIAGQDYTTSMSDILGYQLASRTLKGGTSIGSALQGAASQVLLSPVPGRNAAKIVLLMTDASCHQIEPASVAVANQLRELGFNILVMGINDAANCPILGQVADTGQLYTATDYNTLASEVISQAIAVSTEACSMTPQPPNFNLSIVLDSYNAVGCSPGPGVYTVNYTITNSGQADFSGNLITSFYDQHPGLPSANLLAVHNAGPQTIAVGGTYNGVFSDAALSATTTLYAVTNLDGGQAANGVPLNAALTAAQLAVSPEPWTGSNFSDSISRVNGGSCIPQAVLNLSVSNNGVGCNNITSYETTLCNSGDADALMINSSSFAEPSFVLLDNTTALLANKFPKISATHGNFTGGLTAGDVFGSSLANLGDLDGDGIPDMAVGAPKQTDGGAVWILFMNMDGSVKNQQEISEGQGGFSGLALRDKFGTAVANIGDLDSDGVIDIVVGAIGDNQSSLMKRTGAVYVLFMKNDGTVKAHQKISGTQGGLGSVLSNHDNFGKSVAGLGDLDGDLIPDIVVGALRDDSASEDAGAVWVLFLNSNGTVKSKKKIFGMFNKRSWSGSGVANIGDLDGDGIVDIAVGAQTESDGAASNGAVWILFMRANGSVKGQQKISSTQGGFTETLHPSNWFGSSVANLGDFDGDGLLELGVGAEHENDGGLGRGAVYILHLNSDGTVASHEKISDASGDFSGSLDSNDRFGAAIANMGDFDGDGRLNIAVGAFSDSDGGILSGGSVWILDPHDVLLAGQCVEYSSTYDVSGAAAGTYDFSHAVLFNKSQITDNDPELLPDQNFSVGAVTALDGFDGSQHSDDDVTVPGAVGACPAGDLVDISVSMPNGLFCEHSFVTATVTLTNNSGMTISIADIALSLNQSAFASEPYNLSSGLALPFVNVLDPAYPMIANALIGKTAGTLDLYTLPPGVSTFEIDIDVAVGGPTNLSAQILNLPAGLNASNQTAVTSASMGVSGTASPTITVNSCPTSVAASAGSINLDLAASSTSALMILNWSSGSAGTFTPANLGVSSYTINGLDVQNGYVDFLLSAQTPSACDAAAVCRTMLTGIVQDFGDAAYVHYGIASHEIPASNPYLGDVPPDADSRNLDQLSGISSGADWNGDESTGVSDEDGLMKDYLIYRSLGNVECSVASDSYTTAANEACLSVKVNNPTGAAAQLVAWIDHNGDGQFEDTLSERSIADLGALSGCTTVTDGSYTTGNIPAGCTNGEAILVWQNWPATNLAEKSYGVRVRITTDAGSGFFSDSSPAPTGHAADGEIEDKLISITPTAVTIGEIHLALMPVLEFIASLGVEVMSDAQLQVLLAVWDAEPTAPLAAANRAALLRMLRAYLDPDGDGQVAVLNWNTIEERGTIGFYVERENGGQWVRVNNDLLPGVINAPLGGEYRLADRAAVGDNTYTYRLIELEATGLLRNYGPFILEMR